MRLLSSISLFNTIVRERSSTASCLRLRPCAGPVWLSAERAVAKHVQSGSSVWVASGASTPQSLLQAMADLALDPGGLANVHVYQLYPFGPMRHVAPEARGAFRTSVLFVGPNMREAGNSARADYIPVFLSDVPGLLRRGVFSPDVALIQVSAPDQDGYCSLNCVDATAAAMEVAKHIVAEVNPQAPRTFGQGLVHWSRLSAAVLVDRPMPEVPDRTPTAAEQRVAETTAQLLVRDGSTIQLGVGGVPSSLYRELTGHRGLRLHTELLTSGAALLADSGALHPAEKVVTSFAWGDKRFWELLDSNPDIELWCIGETNKHSTIARMPRMTSINSCIEVDITGQMASESIGDRIYSGFGGQLDFVRGVACSEDGQGLSVIAITSTATDGSPKIVQQLREGAGVVTTRAHAQLVVTEHGVADLRGQSLRARAHRLIRIAAPQHREQLERAAYKRLGGMPAPEE